MNTRAVVPLIIALASVSLVDTRSSSAHSAKPARGIHGLSWLAGSWAGEHDGGVIEEHWMLPDGQSMIGMSRLVIGEKTAFYEFLRIEERADGDVYYIAQPKGRCPAIEFRLAAVDVGMAVFENPQHDHPKVIRYTLSDEGRTLTAVTEGDEKGKRQVHETVMRGTTLTR